MCLFMFDPRMQHKTTLTRIIRYIKDTIHHGLHPSPPLVDTLTTYMHVDWGGCPNTRGSTLEITWSLGM